MKYLLFSLLFIISCNPKVEEDKTPLVQTELYFGQSKNDGTNIPDSVAKQFIDKNVGLVFKKGFTVIQSEGKWYNSDSDRTYSEESFVITCTDTMTESLSASIDSLREKYKKEFQQSAVLRIDKEVRSLSN